MPEPREVADHYLMTALGVDRLDGVMPAIEALNAEVERLTSSIESQIAAKESAYAALESIKDVVTRPLCRLLRVRSNEDIVSAVQVLLPREPRVWERFPELTPTELEALPWTVDVILANGAAMRWTCPEDSIFFEHEGCQPRTLLSLRELGEVREVLDHG